MNVSYKQVQRYIGNRKFFKFFGYFFLIITIVILISTLVSVISWNSRKENYTQVYAFCANGQLYYEYNNQRIYIEEIYNTKNEKITLNIPENETVMMYIDKTNKNIGLYLNMDNTGDQSMINPIGQIITGMITLSVGLYFMLTYKEVQENKATIKPLVLFFIILFVMGIGVIIFQIYQLVEYFQIKEENHVTTATIYSELYREGTKTDYYQPVSYYYINGKRYIYVSDSFEKGTLNENIGKTFEVYYKASDPNQIVKKGSPMNIPILIAGILLTLFSSPFIFLRKNMKKTIEKNTTPLKTK